MITYTNGIVVEVVDFQEWLLYAVADHLGYDITIEPIMEG